MECRTVNPWAWQTGLGFAQAIETSGEQRVLHCAGQAAINADGQPMHEGDMRAQVRLAFDNLETVLTAAGYNLSQVIRLTCYVTDINRFLSAWSEEVSQRLGPKRCQPTSSLLEVTRLAFPSLMVEIEATAVK